MSITTEVRKTCIELHLCCHSKHCGIVLPPRICALHAGYCLRGLTNHSISWAGYRATTSRLWADVGRTGVAHGDKMVEESHSDDGRNKIYQAATVGGYTELERYWQGCSPGGLAVNLCLVLSH